MRDRNRKRGSEKGFLLVSPSPMVAGNGSDLSIGRSWPTPMSRSTGSSASIPAHPSGDRSVGRGGVGRELPLLSIEAILSTGRSTPGSWLVTINESKEVTNLSLHPSRKYAFYQDYQTT